MEKRFNRQSRRKKGHDYASPGCYFITMNIKNRRPVFGELNNCRVVLTDTGFMAKTCWENIPIHFPHVALDEFIIMPDHVHGIIRLTQHGMDTAGAKNGATITVLEILNGKGIIMIVGFNGLSKNSPPYPHNSQPWSFNSRDGFINASVNCYLIDC